MKSDIGLPRGTVALVAHSERWHASYLKECALLQAVLPATVAPYEHVGSTAVPGLHSKPIIDFMAGVNSASQAIQCSSLLARVGYIRRRNGDLPEKVFFVKGPESCRTHHFSLVVRASIEWRRLILFRDCLRQDDSLRMEYDTLKQALAAMYSKDRESYTKAKHTFIQNALNGAITKQEN